MLENDQSEEDKKRYIEKLERHKENTEKSSHYSLERFDVLIITLSSAALAFSIGFIKDVIIDFHSSNLVPLKWAWLCFGSAIGLNLLSQISSYWTSFYEIRLTRIKIREKRGKPTRWDRSKTEKSSKFLNLITIILNYTSLTLFIIGIGLVILYVSRNI
jgi:hypothetical protein